MSDSTARTLGTVARVLAIPRAGLVPPAAVAAAAVVCGAALAALPSTMTLDGVGGIRPGSSEREVERRWGVELELDYAFGAQCAPARLSAPGVTGYVIFRNGRFGAVFLRKGGRTGRGIRIGSTLAQLRAAYGSLLTSRPNEYTPGARDYFVTRARRPHWQLRFDVSPRGRIVEMGFGDRSVRLVEACA